MADRLLLVEDDPRIRRALVLGLVDQGYEVVEAGSGEAALQLVKQDDFDVVLLDLMLPGMDGFAVCRTLRAQGDLPIIMITARSGSEDVIRGLEAGADDYVTKPVVASELAARVRALLRRARPPEPAVLAAGDIRIHPERGVATRAGKDVHLTLTELRLLSELAAAAGRVVTREQLLERVWGYDYFGDTRLLDVHVRRLRRKVEDDPSTPRLVLTVRGVGYRLAARDENGQIADGGMETSRPGDGDGRDGDGRDGDGRDGDGRDGDGRDGDGRVESGRSGREA